MIRRPTRSPLFPVTFLFSAGTTGGSLSAASCILSAGSCSVTFTGTATGTATVLGMYGGDTSHFGSSGTSNTITVNKRSTSTNVTCTSSVVINQASTCTATVTDTDVGTAIVPTGTVTFTSDAAQLPSPMTCTLSAGSCSVTITTPAGSGGTHPVTASYSGDAAHLTSSGTTSLVVNDFTISVSPTSASIVCGTSSSFIVSLTSLGAFTGSIQLSTSALPSGIADGFVPNPVTITTAGSTNTSNLTVSVPSTFAGTSFAFNITGASGGLSHTTSTVTVTVPCNVPVFSAGKLHWTHHLSLTKTSNVQTWTAIVTNPRTTAVDVLVHIKGSSQTNPSLNFDILCGVTCVNVGTTPTPVTIAAGTSVTFSFIQSASTTNLVATNMYSFTAVLIWGSTGSSPSTFVPSNSKSGAFAVVA